MGNSRTIDIYLPPDYESAEQDRFRVLYANDGQDMDRVRLKQTLESLYRQAAIHKIIVVAVHTTANRLDEYGTAGITNANGMGSRAAEYGRFLIEEVMAYVNAHYRTLTGPEHTAIMGWSLGGLAAFDLAWARPDLFGTVGVFSGSFWWRTDASSVSARQDSRIMHGLVRKAKKRPGLRMWFEAGTQDETDDRDGNGVIDAIQDTTELMDELRRKGYRDGDDMVYLEVEGGQHNPATWARVLPAFLEWAFGRTASAAAGKAGRSARR